MKKFFFVLSILLSLSLISKDVLAQSPTPPPTILYPGDVVIVGYNSNATPQQIAIAFLVDINKDTVIGITDYGWDSTNLRFNTISVSNDGVFDWKASKFYSKGEIVIITNDLSSNFNISNSTGDQIFLFQGNHLSPSIIFGVNINYATWQGTSNSSTSSGLPLVLITPKSNLANIYKNSKLKDGINHFTNKTDALSKIVDFNNWVGDDSIVQLLPTTPFSIGATEIDGLVSNEAKNIKTNTITILIISLIIICFGIILILNHRLKNINKI